MELIPIIYTTLLIFAVLAIVVILYSYIAFKIKEKNGLTETPTTEIPQQDIRLENSIKRSVKRVTSYLVHPEYPEPKKVSPPVEQVHIQSKLEAPQKKEQRGRSHKEKPSISKNRIEVVNTNMPPQREVEFKKPQTITSSKKTDSNLNTLGDNIIDKYADDQDDAIYTLNVKNDKKGKN
jgi:hypothetical protein